MHRPDANNHEWVTSEVRVRRAGNQDLHHMVELARARREDYQQYQPRFWRPAADAIAQQLVFFTALLKDEQAAVLVACRDDHITGFAIARIVAAPPVYDPGGATCMVDDFTVDSGDNWPEIGLLLLAAIRSWGAARGAVQLVVVTAHLDSDKRAVLGQAGLELASEWWVGPTTSDMRGISSGP